MDIWNVPEFQVGLRAGLVATGLAGLLALAPASNRYRPLPIAGIAIAVAGLWSINESRAVPGTVIAGVAGVGAAGALRAMRRIPIWCPMIIALPFGALIGVRGDLIDVTWVEVLVAASASIGGALAADFDDAWRDDAIAPGLLALTAVGAYFAVPDTEEVAAFVGVTAPFAVLGWPLGLLRLGRPGAAAAVATLVWAGAIGGRGSPASIIGAVACLGLLASLPLAEVRQAPIRAVAGRIHRTMVILPIVLAHIAFVLVASRVIASRADVSLAATLGGIAAAMTVIIGVALVRTIAS